MKVKIHDKWEQRNGYRIYSETDRDASASLVKENKKTAWVRLNDGNIIKRRKSQIIEN